MKTAILLLVLLPLAYNIHAIDTDEVIIKWNVRSSVEEFWAVVSNWSDSSWVKGTNGVTIDKNDKTIRTLHFFEPTKFDLTVKRYEYEPEKLKFTYGWEDQNGMKTYRGHVSLEPFGNEVMVTYRAVFAPSDESRRKAVKDGFTNQFQNGRVPWLQDKFKKTRSVTGLKWVSLSSSAIIDAPIDDVWKVQSPFDKMTEWYKSFEKVDIVSSGDIRNGTARECHVKGGKIVRETLVSMDPDTYTYSYHFIGYNDPKESPFGKLALENHRAVVTLTPVTIGSTSDSTLVRWSIDFYTDPTTVEVAKKANEFTFKALFDQLAAYFSNKKASSKTAVKLNKSGGIRQAALFPASITATRAWETMHSRDLADVEPLYSALLGTEGKHRRTYHGKFEGMKESVRVDHRYYVDSFTSEFGKGSSTGKRTVVRIDHGPFAKRSAIIFEDNVVGQDETQVANFANSYYNYVTKHSASKPNPCCALPCKNGGDCAATGTGASDFYCDCPEGWTGQTCTDPTFKQWLTNLITPSVEMEEYLRGNKFLMSIVNSIEWLSHRFMKAAVKAKLRKPIVPPPFDTSHPYRTVDGLLNNSYYSRLLPPVPANCPTPAGMVGPAEYPSSETIVERFLARKTFKKSSMYTSLLLAIYGQHFTHQFFKTTEGFGAEGLTYTEHYIDLNNVYGETLETQHMLREHKGGRMKMQTINGEDLPPYYKDVPVKTLKTFPGWETPADREEQLFALGHPFYSSNPGLVALSTIWLREHNRVAGLLQKEHPSWGDEQIFQTTRNILIVECFKITVEDYVGDNLAKGEFKFRFIPTLIQGEVQYQNRIAIEFNHLYHWHEFIPDAYNISGDIIPNHDFLFRKDVVLKHTPSGILDALSNQIAGEANGPNFDRFFGSDVARYVIEHGRGIRLQPLNRYRELVGLEPYTSFDQMVDDEQTQKDLKELYEHPDAVEMFPGMFIERRRDGGLFGATVTQRGIPSTFQGVFGHPLLSEEYWRPSTFGGEVGWEIVNGPNTLESLIRRNTRKWPTKEGPRGQMHTKDRDAALNEKKDL